jgi:hypothetical protein
MEDHSVTTARSNGGCQVMFQLLERQDPSLDLQLPWKSLTQTECTGRSLGWIIDPAQVVVPSDSA